MKTYAGKTWSDFEIGQEFWTGGRTIAEHDILEFSGLTGDFNPLHVDEEFSRTFSPFKTRIPHGPLIHDMYLGLVDRIGILQGTVLAMLELRCKFLAPVLVGDSIHARVVVKDKKVTKKDNQGVCTFAVTLFNQREEPVQEIEHVFLVQR
jgi:acyl dehydratase